MKAQDIVKKTSNSIYFKYFMKIIKKYYSNAEIFDIFKSNKRLLLFLIEQKLIVFDQYCYQKHN